MARIRTIKPQFWGDDEIAELSIEARYLAIGLVSMADDDGRFLASVNAITGFVFPHDNIPTVKVRRWLDEIRSCGFAVFYRVGRLEYGVLPNFRKHQKINRPHASALPEPPLIHGSFSESSVNPHGAITDGSLGEWNGMEWKRNGMEKDGGSEVLTPSVSMPDTDGVIDIRAAK